MRTLMPERRTLMPLLGLLLAVGGCIVTAEPASPPDAYHEREIERTLTVPAGVVLDVRNLAGEATLRPAAGPEARIRAVVRAGADSEEAARELAETVDFELREGAGEWVLRLTYPVDEYDQFHYDRGDGASGVLSWFGTSNTRLQYDGRRVNVSSTRRAGAATLHADLEIEVPRGSGFRLQNAAGSVSAVDVEADLEIDVSSGKASSRNGVGLVEIDTGSGGITVESHRGDVLADTGSGGVDVRDVQGDVTADTGSGSVSLSDVRGAFVSVDTGSGSVTLARVTGALHVDTGSGAVRGEGLVVGERVLVDTGSGSVRLAGDFSAARTIEVDTGSGGVLLTMTAWPQMRVDLRTSSGGVDLELPDVRVLRRDRDSLTAEVGSGTEGELMVSTGSGGISVRQGS